MSGSSVDADGWVKCDDRRLSPRKLDDVLADKTTPYLLLYLYDE